MVVDRFPNDDGVCLAEAGLLERPSDFYTLTTARPLGFDCIGETSAARTTESVMRGSGWFVEPREGSSIDEQRFPGHGRGSGE
ncbi:hypothetical protein ABZV91_08370 [Nocardia sp. NPDC004568]|uniref:hypothetical protein n=1 Tax=Nocardia sp. NPDC004568 TaxID=3154551 RepID=UPI0033A08D9E